MTTAKKRYPNVSEIARLARSNSPASAFDYLPRWCVSTDVRYQEAHGMMKTTVRAPISAASSVARPDQCDWHRQLIERVHEPLTKDCVTSGSGPFSDMTSTMGDVRSRGQNGSGTDRLRLRLLILSRRFIRRIRRLAGRCPSSRPRTRYLHIQCRYPAGRGHSDRTERPATSRVCAVPEAHSSSP